MTQVDLTLERLKKYLSYNPNTGIFTRVSNVCGHATGSKVGSLDSRKRYLWIGIGYKVYPASHLAWFYVYGTWPKDQLDHINCNKLDNRISNLREATNEENKRNTPIQRNNTSGYKRVYWNFQHKKWQISIRYKGKLKHLGFFDNPKDGYIVGCKAAKKLHGEFARS